jgi:hypothetical protein
MFHSKILRGFETYERNTGKRHRSQPDNYKRAVGEEALIEGQGNYWYGAHIEVAQIDFVLIPLKVISLLEPQPSTTPSALTPEAVIFSFPLHHVTLVAVDTQNTTHLSPQPRNPWKRLSPSPMEVALPSLECNTPTPSRLRVLPLPIRRLVQPLNMVIN